MTSSKPKRELSEPSSAPESLKGESTEQQLERDASEANDDGYAGSFQGDVDGYDIARY